MKKYALVGVSGTGKSYKAMTVAKDNEINFIIDDGLLIKGSKILGGKSAKRQHTKITAVKTALMFEKDHREGLISLIKEYNPNKILILGTSVKMVERISNALELGAIDQFIYIDEVSTPDEIKKARYHRRHHGKHVIPAPTLEVKKDFSGYFLDTLNIFTRRKNNEIEITEKTVVRPTFSYLGKYTISNKAMIQLVEYSSRDAVGIESILKIRIKEEEDGIRIRVDVAVKMEGSILDNCKKLQSCIYENVENMTQINILDVSVVVRSIKMK